MYKGEITWVKQGVKSVVKLIVLIDFQVLVWSSDSENDVNTVLTTVDPTRRNFFWPWFFQNLGSCDLS